ncbi:MAG: hypothetical protein H6Q16_1491 [Bacteroidetes bacterium]|nr:hypothetical protein [Bacteroidota bacterium]
MKKIITLISLILNITLLYAQSEPTISKPYGSSLSFELTKKLKNNLSISFEQELRTRNNFKEFDRTTTFLSFDYSPEKYFKIGCFAGLILNNEFYSKHTESGRINIDTNYLQPRYRGGFYATGLYKIGNFKLSLRERIQFTKWDKFKRIRPEKIIFDTLEARQKFELRSKLELSYKIPKTKIEIYSNAELFLYLNRKRNLETLEYEDPFVNEIRYIIGLNYNFNKHHELNLYFRYNRIFEEIDSYNIIYLIGCGYAFKF